MRADDYEIAAFFALVVVFELCERLWPARPVDRWQDLKLDVLSFAFALTVNRVCTHAIRSFVGDVTPAALAGTVHYLQRLPSLWKIVPRGGVRALRAVVARAARGPLARLEAGCAVVCFRAHGQPRLHARDPKLCRRRDADKASD